MLGGWPSTRNVSGSRKTPPALSSQPANAVVVTPAGRPQRLASTTPVAIPAAPPSPATPPPASSGAVGPITPRPTPATPTMPQPTRHRDSGSPSRYTAGTATISGSGGPSVPGA